jgi:hypothetical protein
MAKAVYERSGYSAYEVLYEKALTAGGEEV